MKVRLVSHASILITTESAVIWTDPWLFGKAFNDSWALFPPADTDLSFLDRVDYLWFSHEHPDHLHFPTLKSLSKEFKQRVTVLYKKDNTDKVPNALRSLGFEKVQLLPHRALTKLPGGTSVYCYQVAFVDSCLAVIDGVGRVLFNINDAPFSPLDARYVLTDLGKVEVIFNQFSYATYDGRPNYREALRQDATKVLDVMVLNHRDLRATTTIPFASFVHFCTEDNRFMNEFVNTPMDVDRFFRKHGCHLDTLFMGEEFELDKAHDSERSLALFDAQYAHRDALVSTPSERVPQAAIFEAFHKLVKELRLRYPRALLAFLGPMTVYVPDLDTALRFSIRSGSIEAIQAPESACDLTIFSQPLFYCFQHTWGGQTLSISGRFQLRFNYRRWFLYRIVFSLNNAEIYLKLPNIVSRSFLRFVGERSHVLLRQVFFQMRLVSAKPLR